MFTFSSLRFGVVAVLLAGSTPLASAVAIVVKYDYDSSGFFDDPARRRALEAAAQVFESRLVDQLTSITASGNNTWSAFFSHPATGALVELNNPTIPANELHVFAGGRLLGDDTLGLGGPGGVSANGTPQFVNNVLARGQTGALAAKPTDFGPWGGSITFDLATAWYFDPDINTQEAFPDRNDFYSIAIHEFAHLLGFGTADSWKTFVQGSLFTGPVSRAQNSNTSVPLEPGLNPGHWAEDTQGRLRVGGGFSFQETAMDPDLLEGTRKYFTELDFAGLDDLGWTVIPEPASSVLLSGALLLLAARRRDRRASGRS